MAPRDVEQRVAAVRRFNRFYTCRIGVLREAAYQSPFSLTQVRVLYELAHRQRPTATELGRELGLDPGYLSRILRGFQQRGLVARTRSTTDGRRSHVALTAQGRKVFAPLNARSHDEIAALLTPLPPAAQAQLIDSMQTIEQVLGDTVRPTISGACRLRPPEPGDFGWVVHRHGALYAQEYGYDAKFEALVAEIVAHFVQHFEAKRERCWIAEQDGDLVGSVFLVQKTATVAKLRLLLVEPRVRGLGIGRRLVEECVRFARQAGYRKLTLWTQHELGAARRLYEAAGFRLVHRHRHHSFGKDLVAETWDLPLSS
ncbi:MAG TPA: helix-turn-helix domain-containing GNAT family N-acetyltransferase [Gemmatimonadales bacterium]|nr:helix-turn-helix domain-containing GNAT family N-acetyltransferase [Gemmatimonadales bacterium]